MDQFVGDVILMQKLNYGWRINCSIHRVNIMDITTTLIGPTTSWKQLTYSDSN
jgi:hypothetical protein